MAQTIQINRIKTFYVVLGDVIRIRLQVLFKYRRQCQTIQLQLNQLCRGSTIITIGCHPNQSAVEFTRPTEVSVPQTVNYLHILFRLLLYSKLVEDRTSICEPCITTDRPDGDDFGTYLADFLDDPPTMDCPKGGSAAYSSSVNITAGN